MDNYHIVSTDSGWELRKEGAARASKTAGTKDELLKMTGTFMEGKTASVKIHKRTVSSRKSEPTPGQLTHARPKVNDARSVYYPSVSWRSEPDHPQQSTSMLLGSSRMVAAAVGG